MSITYSDILYGAALLSDILGPLTNEDVAMKQAFFLGGSYDKEIAVFCFEHENGKLPESHEQALSDEKAKASLERMKNFVRSRIQGIINEEIRQQEKLYQRQKEQAMNSIREKIKQQNKPAPEGTVKELAARYNKSISEIRRMKAEGRLHELGSSSN